MVYGTTRLARYTGEDTGLNDDPQALSTIIVGIVSYHSHSDSAKWAALGLWWMDIALTVAVSIGSLTLQIMEQPEHDLQVAAGVYVRLCSYTRDEKPLTRY